MRPCGSQPCRAGTRPRRVCDAAVVAVSRMSGWRCFRTVAGCTLVRRYSRMYLLARCLLHSHVLHRSRPMPMPMHAHYSLTLLLPLPHTTRCGDAMLAYAAAARLPHAALLHTTTCLDGRVDSVTHRPGSARCCCCTQHTHPPPVRPLPRPSICGLVLVPTLRACLPAIRRQTWFDSSTSHAPTAWVTAFPSRTAACVPTGRPVASRLQVALLRYALLLHTPSHLALHTLPHVAHPANRDENCLQACSERLARPSCVTPPLLPRST
jgi:hypothetical protein